MRIVTWNVNSLNARVDRVDDFIEYAKPDVLLMQETKMSDEQFLYSHFEDLGYESAHCGEGRWNGVAILSRVGISDVSHGFDDREDPDPEVLLISATCGGIRVSSVYVPNGRAVDDPHYKYKLSWMERLRLHMERTCESSEHALVGGDFNICPDNRDIWDPENPEIRTHVTDSERKALENLQKCGLADLFRKFYDGDQLYSWWDYRDGGFHKRRGLRIDLLLGTSFLADKAEFCLVDRNARKGTKPSDHAPVMVDVAI